MPGVHREVVACPDVVEVHAHLHALVVQQRASLAQIPLVRQRAQLTHQRDVRRGELTRSGAQQGPCLPVQHRMQHVPLKRHHALLVSLRRIGWTPRDVRARRRQFDAGYLFYQPRRRGPHACTSEDKHVSQNLHEQLRPIQRGCGRRLLRPRPRLSGGC